MDEQSASFDGRVEVFDRPGGWHFVALPEDLMRRFGQLADRGLIAVEAQIGASSWQTSLLPMGDGTHSLALPAPVRRSSRISKGRFAPANQEPRLGTRRPLVQVRSAPASSCPARRHLAARQRTTSGSPPRGCSMRQSASATGSSPVWRRGLGAVAASRSR